MDHVRSFNNVPVDSIREYLSRCEQPFETSQLYSSARDAKFVDVDLRKSVFRAIVDPKLFDLVDGVLRGLNESDRDYKYLLRRNDVTHIKYSKGGFFKRHKDYLSTTSNLIEEFTLIICVTPAGVASGVAGGDTTIFTYGGEKTFDTSTPGSGVLFRKDLDHEGTELKNGEKHIITANIWATRKEQSKQVLLVTFPSSSENPSAEGSDDAERAIQQVASASSSYVLPVDVLTGMLAAHVQWANRSAEDEGKDPPPVVSYECRDFDYGTFGVVVKILNRSYVSERAIKKSQECLDYFGPFKAENLLIELAIDKVLFFDSDSSDEDEDDGGSDDDDDGEKQPNKRQKAGDDNQSSDAKQSLFDASDEDDDDNEAKKQANEKQLAGDDNQVPSKGNGMPSPADFDADVIVCENEARMRAVANVARMLNEPYVPFKILFVEGVLQTGGEMGISAVDIPMNPAVCLVGDYNNVFSLWKASQKTSPGPLSLKGIHSNNNFWNRIPKENAEALMKNKPGTQIDLLEELPTAGKDGWKAMFDVECDLGDTGYGLGLRVGFGATDDIKSKISNSVFGGAPHGIMPHGEKIALLPGLDTNNPTPKHGDAVATSLFHRDENGLTAFTSEEAELASDYIASIGLDERVKACLQKKRFELPQHTDEVQAHFCNETVYGNVNILWVCGVIRLDSRPTESTATATNVAEVAPRFDAWPAPEAKAQTVSARHCIHELAQNQEFWWS